MGLSRAYGDTWAAMERLVDVGKTKLIGNKRSPFSRCFAAPVSFHRDTLSLPSHITLLRYGFLGISNFSSPKIRKLLSMARIKPVVNQIECHPYWPQKGLVKLCQENGIHVTALGPLGCVPIPALTGRKGPGPLEDETVGYFFYSRRRCL